MKNVIRLIVMVVCSVAMSTGQTGGIKSTVMFMNYDADASATMIMAYVWQNDTSWAVAQDSGVVKNAMFAVTPAPAMTGTYDVTFSELAKGTYWLGVFETTMMSHSSAVATVGYYNDQDTMNYSDSMTPTPISVDADTVVLKTMMAKKATVGVDPNKSLIPDKFALYDNFPNPFNPSTVIRYALPLEGVVNISIFNVLGERVSTLLNRYERPGEYLAVWNGTNDTAESMPSGLYFVRMKHKKGILTKKITLLR